MREVIVSFKLAEEVRSYIDTYCNEFGTPIVFNSKESAIEHLKRTGYTDEQFGEMWLIRAIGKCPKCGGPLFPSFLPDYHSQCFDCDEDFYKFEKKQG